MWIKDLRCDAGEGGHDAIVGKPAFKRSRSTCSRYREEERGKAVLKAFAKAEADGIEGVGIGLHPVRCGFDSIIRRGLKQNV